MPRHDAVWGPGCRDVSHIMRREVARSFAQSKDDVVENPKQKEQAALEGRQGFELWRSIRNVVNLYVNVRAPGVLARFQEEMRAGKISDDQRNRTC